MAKFDDEDRELEIPGDEDENVGEGFPKKKREKKRKSKEERAAERRVIFWTLLVVLLITLGFWFAPKIAGVFRGESWETEIRKEEKPGVEKKDLKGKDYVEITL